MIYHMIGNLGKKLTGLEHASIKRLKLFNNAEMYSKILTVRYNTSLHENIKNYGIAENELENMYDYFQNAQLIEKNNLKVEEIFSPDDYVIEELKSRMIPGVVDYKIFSKQKHIANIHTKNDVIFYIKYLNFNNEIMKSSYYDQRGFLSSEKFLNDKNQTIIELFFTPDREPVIEKYYTIKENQSNISMIHVRDKFQRWHYFFSEEEFITFYLEALLIDNKDSVIVDRNSIFDKLMININKKIKKIAVLHSLHTKGNDHMNGQVNDYYKEIFKHPNKFDAIIVLTELQKKDLLERYVNISHIHCIPHFISEDSRKRAEQVSMSNPPKIVVMARYSKQKRLDHTIKAFNNVVNIIPEAELHLFGYGGHEKELRELVSNLHLENSVKFRRYLNDLSEEYRSSKLFVLSSKYEGFCLALLGAISYGIPIVSYNIKYGPRDMIDNEKLGYLTSENPDDLAEKMILLLTDPILYEQFSNNAYAKSFEFDEKIILDKWKTLFEKL